MLIDLTREEIVPELEEFEINRMFNNEHFKSWFLMNEEFINEEIKTFVYTNGWAFGGAAEVHYDLFKVYDNAPYNLRDKYGARNTNTSPMFLAAA